MYQHAANAVLFLHLCFIGLVLGGGLIVRHWPRFFWIHLPILVWGFLVEAAGWYCPLTDLENYLLRQANGLDYNGDFISHTLLNIIYPAELTRPMQWGLAALVVVVNAGIYAWIWQQHKKK